MAELFGFAKELILMLLIYAFMVYYVPTHHFEFLLVLFGIYYWWQKLCIENLNKKLSQLIDKIDDIEMSITNRNHFK